MAYATLETWSPAAKTKPILERAMHHINSVSYGVSARWLFYRLLQDGLYKAKSDYNTMIALMSRARRAYWNGWDPLTLQDETRSMIPFSGEGDPPDPDIAELVGLQTTEAVQEKADLEEALSDFHCTFDYTIDPGYLQESFCVVMFEAKAMIEQFKTYTKGLTLIPCGGQPSIPYRYNVAKYINERCEHYGKEGMVLYFGDLDWGGGKIFQSVSDDLEEWCDNVSIEYCGLTEAQVSEHGIPENPDHPGSYQWEALDDSAAREIIEAAVEQFTNTDAESEAEEQAEEITEKVRTAVDEALEAGETEDDA